MFARSHTVRTQDGLHTYNDANAPEVEQPGLETQQPYPEVGYHQVHGEQEKEYDPRDGAGQKRERKIYRLRPVTFWLLLALIAVIVIAAAVGGGIGGSQMGKSGSDGKNVADSAGTTTPTAVSTVTAAGATITVTRLANGGSSASATPSSTCQQESSSNFVGGDSKLAYKKVCNSNLSSGSARQTIFASPTRTFDECIGMCDSYNWFMDTKNMTVANWNWSGQGEQALGMCWCSQTEGYQMSTSSGEDSACLVGSFGSSDLPGG